MHFNPISAEAIEPILQALHFNNTLKKLRLDNYPDNTLSDIKSIEQKVNKARENQGCYVKLCIDLNPKYEYLPTYT